MVWTLREDAEESVLSRCEVDQIAAQRHPTSSLINRQRTDDVHTLTGYRDDWIAHGASQGHLNARRQFLTGEGLRDNIVRTKLESEHRDVW